MDRRSRFEYTGGSFEATVSSPPWDPAQETEGGSDIAASGVPASYNVRKDHLIKLRLRIWESEYEAFEAGLIEFGQSAEAFTWLPDADEVEGYLVYLQEPARGAKLEPARDSNFPRLFEVSIVLRSADGSLPFRPYFSE
jgi:hypothetical protein